MKTINCTPHHCEFAGSTEGFTLTFFDRTGTDQQRRIVLHFDFWWTKFLARHLWQAIAYRRNELAQAEAAMKEITNG